MVLSPTAFESFFNQYVHPALLLDTDAPRYTVLAVSDAFLEATGQQRAALLGKGFFEVYGKESRGRELSRLQTAIDRLTANRKPFVTSAYQYNVEREDGSRATRYWNLDTRLISLPDAAGTPREIISHTAFDVTDQVLIQQVQTHLLEHSEQDKLRVSEERQTLRKLVDSERVGALTLSPVRNETGSIANFRFRTMTSMLRTQFQKLTGVQDHIEYLSDVVGKFEKDDAFEKCCHTLETGKSNQLLYSYPSGNGDRWLQVTITSISPEELLITIIDQTEIKRIQLQLEQTIEVLRRTNANLEDFAYAASHDLQEPLRKIQTFSAMLHARCENALDAQSLALLARMQSATTRMRALIEDLLQYSRLSLGNETFEIVCLKDLVQELLSETADELSICDAEVDFSGLESVLGLSRQLRILFKNLLDNALKFAHKERPLAVTIKGARVTEGSEIALVNGVGKGSSYLRIEFSDNGIGFDPDYSERVFQMFQRLHGRSESTGTGMGLAIAQKIVTNHKGIIRAIGKPGEGATFTFYLPLVEDEACV